ncbi:hypothetical protein U9M48_004683 [Paspalum notatum var. saurae]|uniref:Uncharacterized protein n=1 Tax=Paspalum notatum var. saurae TaxID=547442 RepID=A0AAQ3PKV6_PASNO
MSVSLFPRLAQNTNSGEATAIRRVPGLPQYTLEDGFSCCPVAIGFFTAVIRHRWRRLRLGLGESGMARWVVDSEERQNGAPASSL